MVSLLRDTLPPTLLIPHLLKSDEAGVVGRVEAGAARRDGYSGTNGIPVVFKDWFIGRGLTGAVEQIRLAFMGAVKAGVVRQWNWY